MKVAVVGATGLVGSKMLQVLAERNFPVDELIPVASERSIGKEVEFKGKKFKVVGFADAIAAKPDVAIFSAGGGTSLELAPQFAAAGITVIDNSSAWRMDPTKKLVVPEVNAHVLTADDKIIAGVCSGIANSLRIDPVIMRILFVLFFYVAFWIYIVLWFVVPVQSLKTNVTKRLYRDPEHSAIGGVCAGLADYFDMDATLVRVLWLLVVLCGGTGILLYAILWIALPLAPYQVAGAPPAQTPVATQAGN